MSKLIDVIVYVGEDEEICLNAEPEAKRYMNSEEFSTLLDRCVTELKVDPNEIIQHLETLMPSSDCED